MILPAIVQKTVLQFGIDQQIPLSVFLIVPYLWFLYLVFDQCANSLADKGSGVCEGWKGL
jgi:hypothetical protein